jgi:hypothetical protein
VLNSAFQAAKDEATKQVSSDAVQDAEVRAEGVQLTSLDEIIPPPAHESVANDGMPLDGESVCPITSEFCPYGCAQSCGRMPIHAVDRSEQYNACSPHVNTSVCLA